MSRTGSGFALRHARRELRGGVRRLGGYMVAIALGVAALVAINSFRANAVRSIAAEARGLLGADLRLSSNRPFPDSVSALLDSVARSGRRVTRVTSTISVAVAANGRSRLAQLRALDGVYPFYGERSTEPAGQWGTWQDRRAIVEPSLLEDLGVRVGDSIQLGSIRMVIAAAATDLPAEVTFQNALGPRIYLSSDALAAAGVLRFGSLARFHAYIEEPDAAALERLVDRNHDLLTRQQVGFDTAADQAEDLASALDAMGRFLGLVGLTALLLGGLGVASAVNVFVRERRDTIAVLRCLGATSGAAFGAYLLQALGLGLAGAAAGALLGTGIQFLLPAVLGAAIPFPVRVAVEWRVALTGMLLGAWVSFVFALLPLLAVRAITPLHALRQDVEGGRAWWRDPWHWVVLALLLASLAGLSIWQARRLPVGLAFTAAILVGLLVLWSAAALLTRVVRRVFPRRASYPVRQGVANLFRPRNQTTIVTMAVGFGVFLLASLWVVQRSLIGWLDVEDRRSQPNVVAFDVQPDQLADVRARIDARALHTTELTPIITARVQAVNGRPVAELLATPRQPRIEPWALRREYRHTYRAELKSSEQLAAGQWWDDVDVVPGLARVSAEHDVARSLGVDVGDRITWDVQGVSLESVITSLRRVDWARFETNFFFVFEPGPLDAAPATWVALARVESDSARQGLQRDVVIAHPNVSMLDISSVTATLERIIGRVALAVRFMALFSVVGGVVVLAAALAAGRGARAREIALLRTLGARDRQVRRILLTEYAALGALAGVTGTLLGGTAGWLLARFLFELPVRLPWAALLGFAAAACGLAVLMGTTLGRDALRRPPLVTLRESAG
ncbi:MAG TPA: FtsX-like permease family protein [Longimicrobiales bacterium]|nr:FtsX-like permease family protein [Longimicrobiales bacterium]